MIAMLVGTALVLAALAYVLYPLVSDLFGRRGRPPATSAGAAAPASAEQLSAIDALREVEFDYATGKLSETDYRALKSQYTRMAAAEMGGAPPPPPACPVCGIRPEADALYCSSCGAKLISR